jgi:hypothetical protein
MNYAKPCELQDLAYKEAKNISKDLSLSKESSRERTALLALLPSMIKAWDTCADRRRILRGKPLPGSRRPAPEPTRPTKCDRPRNRPPQFGVLPVALPSNTKLKPA